MKKILVVLVLLTFSISSFSAEEGSFKPSFKPDMLMFFNYGIDLDKNTNLFELNRMYLGFKAKPSENVMFRGTLDVQYDSVNGSKGAFFKYVYAEISKLIPMSKLVFGQLKTGLIDFELKHWIYREVYKSPIDSAGFDKSTDMGIALDGKIPLGLGAFHIGYFTGEGFKGASPEADKSKAFSLRASLTPFSSLDNRLKNLMFTFYYKMFAPQVSGGDSTDVLGLMLSIKCKMMILAAEYITESQGNNPSASIISLYSIFHIIPNLFDIFARIDLSDPDTDTAFDLETNFIAGFKYWVAKKTSIGLSYIRSAAAQVENKINLTFTQAF